ncbi:MAG: hypothetical protein KDD42_08115 [Bdellovibrionales bacterium]|nr:hypothetical protein [Bdellovibrionales bacterium]
MKSLYRNSPRVLLAALLFMLILLAACQRNKTDYAGVGEPENNPDYNVEPRR